MTVGARAPLYTPEMLAAAVALAGYPIDDTLPLRGEARSRSCGSRIEIGLRLDAEGRVAAVGLRPQACAVGQAAASVFATTAAGQSRAEIAQARAALAAWLAGEGEPPELAGVAMLAPARGYPARHPAALLAWDAALDALGAAVERC